jgi:hypothetical protein
VAGQRFVGSARRRLAAAPGSLLTYGTPMKRFTDHSPHVASVFKEDMRHTLADHRGSTDPPGPVTLFQARCQPLTRFLLIEERKDQQRAIRI